MKLRPRVQTLVLATAAALVFASCWLDRAGLIPDASTGGSGGAMTTASGGSGGSPASSSSSNSSSSGTGGAGVGGSAGSGGGGGGGGEPLDDSALVVRYFLDEAASGQAPTTVNDAAPNPMDLAITYQGTMAWTESLGQRGLSWAADGEDGRASIVSNGTKLRSMLNNATAATMEVVVAIQSVNGAGSRIVHLGANMDQGRFTLASALPNSFDYRMDSVSVGNWTVAWPTYPTRQVLHLVVDTTQAAPGDRVLLFVDGASATNNITPPAQNAKISVPNSEFFVLGNREVGGRSFAGVLHYVALYAKALTPATIAQHVSRLTASDDTMP